MEVLFYTFAKKHNSTARPSGGTSYDCILKRDCSVIDPVILLNVGVTTNMSQYNYCYISDFQRYYYIAWEYRDSLWEAHGRVDTMASFRTDIGAASLYMLRAANSYNTTIVDTYYPITTQVSRETDFRFAPWIKYDAESAGGSTGGLYVVGIIGAGANGSVMYYGFDKLYFQQFAQKLFSTDTWFGIEWDTVVGISEQILKTLVNPAQYIVSCKWFPLDIYGTGITMTDKIKIGWWEISQQCYIISFPTLQLLIGTFTFPKHPQAQARGDYLYFKPYSYYYFESMPFGIIELNRSDYRDETVEINVLVDMMTGEAELRCFNENVKTESVKVQFAVEIPLLQMTINPLGVVGGINSYYRGAGQLATGLTVKQGGFGSIQGGISSMGSGIGETVDSLIPKGTIINEQSSFMDFVNNQVVFYGKFFRVAEENVEELGKTLCDTRKVSALGGYMLPAEVDFPLHGSFEEQEEVRSIMKGGFYYE